MSEAEVLVDQYNVPVIIKQGASSRITATLKDEDEVALDTASILSLELNLTKSGTTTVINARGDQDILNKNGGTLVDDGGTPAKAVMTMKLSPLDNTIVDAPIGEIEQHEALFTWTFLDGDGVLRTGRKPWILEVKSLAGP